MKTEFTKGEWYAGFQDFTSDSELPYIEIKSGYKLIAKATYGENEKERAANAKLIAAAPKMFDAISDFLWRAEQRKMRGTKLSQRELNDIEDFERIIKSISE